MKQLYTDVERHNNDPTHRSINLQIDMEMLF